MSILLGSGPVRDRAGGVLLRRNILIVLMSLELLLNSVNINFIAFAQYYDDFRGQIFAIFVIAITAGGSCRGPRYIGRAGEEQVHPQGRRRHIMKG